MNIVAALYRFVDLPDYQQWREPLLSCCLEAEVKGTLLLAPEGINGTIAGPRSGIDRVLDFLRADQRFAGLEVKESQELRQPFYRMKVKLKKEIVTIGIDSVDPNRRVGTYVSAGEWNALLDDPEVLVIDTRNDYEVAIGSFAGAVNPNISTFRDFPNYVQQQLEPARHKKVAMFCTGGIRCEKASSYMLEQGFDQVYHLQGGILKYLEQVPAGESKWQGECFVFDNRVAVNHRLEKGSYELCHGCRYPITEQDKQSAAYEEGVSCPHCHDRLSDEQRSRFRERQKQVVLARQRNQQHVGAPPPARQIKSTSGQ